MIIRNVKKEDLMSVAEINNEITGFCRYTLENLYSKQYEEVGFLYEISDVYFV